MFHAECSAAVAAELSPQQSPRPVGVPMIWMAVSAGASIRGSTGAMVAMYAAIARLEECFEHQGELSS
jgi:hypothetical protein